MSELPRSAPSAHASLNAGSLTTSPPSVNTKAAPPARDGARTRAPDPSTAAAEPDAPTGFAASASDRRRFHDDDMLTVAAAARVARRSVRTLRRAYMAGRMVAHRDGNGRGVTIR